MKMRNLNPYAGLRQVTTGFLYLPRRPILEWLRKKKIDAGQLGSFIIFLILADWDKDPHRQGYIRFSDSDLFNICRIPIPTLRRWREQLASAGLMEKISGCYRITNFDLFTFSGAKEFSGKVTDEEIGNFFPDVIKDILNLEEKRSKMEESELKNTSPFNCSFKKSFEGGCSGMEVARNDHYSFNAGIARRKDKDERSATSGSLTSEDINWINKDVTDSLEPAAAEDQFERDVEETLF